LEALCTADIEAKFGSIWSTDNAADKTADISTIVAALTTTDYPTLKQSIRSTNCSAISPAYHTADI
jgi:hypothetical protein